MRPLIKWTLWERRWSTLWWIIGVVAFISINMVFYPTIRDQASEFEKTFSQLSEGTKALLSDTGEFFSPVGYLSSQIFYLMMPMLLGILAIGAGASLIGKEEREGTIELILSRPVPRGRLLASKAIAGILILLAVGLIGTMATAIWGALVDIDIGFGYIVLAGLASILMAMCFGAIAFAITTLGRGARAASIGGAVFIALGGYILVSLSGSVDWLKWPAKAFPFDYYHPAEILTGTYNWANMLFIVGVIIACVIVSWLAFRRRDISAS